MIQTNSQGSPLISIIVPARNEENHIAHLLDALLDQDCSYPFEIIVVDGLSTDHTVKIIQAYIDRDSRIQYLSNPKRFTPSALNIGINASQGEIVLRMDGHWLPGSRDFLLKIVDAFQRYPEADCLGGRSIRITEGEKGEAIEDARSSIIGGGISFRNFRTQEKLVDQENIAYIWRRRVFAKVGLFDERFIRNQDNEFNLRTLEAGFKTLYSPAIIFVYHVPSTYKRLYRQLSGFAEYVPLMLVKHHKIFHISYMIPPLGLLIWLFSCISAVYNGTNYLIPFILAGLYFIILIFSSFGVCYSHKKYNGKYWSFILGAYPLIHVAVAVGYFYGIFRIWNYRDIPEVEFLDSSVHGD